MKRELFASSAWVEMRRDRRRRGARRRLCARRPARPGPARARARARLRGRGSRRARRSTGRRARKTPNAPRIEPRMKPMTTMGRRTVERGADGAKSGSACYRTRALMADKPKVKAPQKRSTPSKSDGGDQRRLLIIGGALAVLVVVAGRRLLPPRRRRRRNERGRGPRQRSRRPIAPWRSSRQCPTCRTTPISRIPPERVRPGTPTRRRAARTTASRSSTAPTRIRRRSGASCTTSSTAPSTSSTGTRCRRPRSRSSRAFYDQHETGTILAPYPKLGDKIALGAWYADGLPEASSDRGSGILAKCTAFDEDAFAAFFDAFQFKGPESSIIPPSSMAPGSN